MNVIVSVLAVLVGLQGIGFIILITEVVRLRHWDDVLTNRIYHLEGVHYCVKDKCYSVTSSHSKEK